ncbi:hypothetical protein PINS_up009717 [Pythium insidiosum]|nr:hypothetical protein PINS_up009717 [Pythium insidiosum]
MLELIERFDDQKTPREDQCQFVITSLILGNVEVQPHEVPLLLNLVTRHSASVAIRYLHLGEALAKWADESTLTAIQQFFAVALRDDRPNPLEALAFDGKLLSLECMVALGSALRYNRRLRLLNLGSRPTRRSNDKYDLAWAWLVFGIVDATSSSNLQALEFTSLPVGDISEYLSSDEPARWLLESEFPVVRKIISKDAKASFAQAGQEWVTLVKDHAKFRMLPKANAQSLAFSFVSDQSLLELEVVVTLSTWTCVILPGFGLGWLKNADILERVNRPLDSGNRRCPVRFVSPWTFTTDEEAENAIRLLRDTRLGSGLRMLSCNWFFSVKNVAMEILTSCPALQQIRLPCAALFCDDATMDLMRNLEVVDLASVPFSQPLLVRDRSRPWNLLAKLMLAPSCRLRCIAFLLDGPTDEEWKAFCDALAANTTVEYVHITSGNSLVRALAEQENRRVLHRTQTKLAFLSVLRRRQSASSSCSAGQLDAAIVSSVFAFAATSVQRRVRGSVVATMW